MPRKSPFAIELSTDEATELNRRATQYTRPYFEVVRARMILLAALGLDNDEIAARLDTRREVVSQWRKRFFTDRLSGLDERARPGRPKAGHLSHPTLEPDHIRSITRICSRRCHGNPSTRASN